MEKPPSQKYIKSLMIKEPNKDMPLLLRNTDERNYYVKLPDKHRGALQIKGKLIPKKRHKKRTRL